MAETETALPGQALVGPTINLNGTAKEDLLRQCLYAIGALDDALTALGEMTPHGRDYPGKPDVLDLAKAQHSSRIERVRSVRGEVEVLAEYIG